MSAELLSARDAAARLQISVRSFHWAMVKDPTGIWPTIKNAHAFWYADDLDAWAKANPNRVAA